MTRSVGVVANPDGWRWTGFAMAAGRVGLDAVCVPWSTLLATRAGDSVLTSFDLIRIDSPAQEADVDALLCGRRRERGEVLGSAAWADGINRALTWPAGTSVPCTPHPEDVADLMDKAVCHRRLLDAGLPVAPALAPVKSWEELLAAIVDRRWPRVFVKPRYGSSGSGVIALSVSPRGRFRAVAHLDVERTPSGVRLFNSRRLVALEDERLIGEVVNALAPDGVHVERWAPKLVVAGGPVDLRVVCVAGSASHVVARVGAGPITNLHAGGRRLGLDVAREKLGEGFDAAVEVAEGAAACFPRSLQLGVDVGVLTNRRSVVIFEANAFGDLLLDTHDLKGRRRSVWDAQAVAIAAGWTPAVGAGAAA